MRYTWRYILNKTIITFCNILEMFAIRLRCAVPGIKQGIYLVRSYHGYTVQIDGVTLDFDLSYEKAEILRNQLEVFRN